MFFESRFIPLSLPFSTFPLIGVILGVLFPKLILLSFVLFSAFALASIFSSQKGPTLKIPCLLLLGFLVGSSRIVFLKKKYVLLKPLSLNDKPLCLTSIIKTGNSFWPYRLTLTGFNYSSFSFFLYSKKKPPLEISDIFSLPSLLIKPPKDKDFQLYLVKEGVIGTSFMEINHPYIISRPFFSFSRWVDNKKETLLFSLRKKMSKSSFSFFCSLFIGDKKQINYLTEQYKPLFKTWGISHHLARSGLHLIIFIFLWQLLLSFLPFSFFKKQSILFVICFFYFCITPSSISFNRAFFLFVFYNFCTFFSWQVHTVHLLNIVALAVLIYNPFQLFFLDFQLSFFLTFCLAWLSSLKPLK